jgi:hypothetical protein
MMDGERERAAGNRETVRYHYFFSSGRLGFIDKGQEAFLMLEFNPKN